MLRLMLTVLFCICMYRIAQLEKRRGWLWALITALASVTLQTALGLAYWGAVSGLLLAYGAMAIANARNPVRKGPFLK